MASSDETNVERHRRVLALFRAARAVPRNQRARWVQEAAQGDTLVEGELTRRLAAWDRLNERRDLGVDFDSYYDLLKRIGRGGMGAVYLARQVRLDRFEAVKKINPDFASDADAVRMFTAEARAAAALRHGGIVQVYAVGSHEGQPAYAMEYLSGGTLQDRLAREAIAPREAAELVAQIADAVDYAHQCGIVHRDLKPANILLDSEGRPKVVDFGLARGPHFQHDVLTGVAGTPAYMSPEQAASAEVGPAADVHALGAVLYALLTGEPPFSGKEAGEVIDKVLHAPPPPPRRKDRGISGRLQKICLRCLEKDPKRRYASAGDVAAALRSWLARRRQLTRLASAMVVFGMVASLLTLTGLRGREATSANVRAASERRERLKQESLVAENKRLAAERDLAARRNRYAAAMKLAQQALESGDIGQVMRLLEAQRPPPGKEDLRGFEWHWLWRICHQEWQLLGRHGAAVRCVAWLSDGQTIVSGGTDGVVRVWDAKSRKPAGEIAAHTGAVLAAMFSADGKRLATSGEDGRARLWDVASWNLLADFDGPGGPLGALALSADGTRLATGVRDEHFAPRICLWDVATRQRTDLPPADRPVHALAFAPRSDLLVAGIGPCLMWDTPCDLLLYRLDAASPAPPIRLAGHQAAVTSVAFSPDGRAIVSGSRDCSVRIWDVAERVEIRQAYCQGPGERRILSVAISRDGASLASVGIESAIRIWDAASLTEQRQMRGHRDVVRSVAWAPQGGALVTSGDDGDVLLWNTAGRPPPDTFQADHHEIMGLAISPDGRMLATVGGALSKPGDVKLWKLPLEDVPQGEVVQSRELRGHATVFSPDGSLLAVAGGDWNRPGRIDLWQVSTRSKIASRLLIDAATPDELRQQQELQLFRTATSVAFSSDGRWIAAGGGVWGDERRPGLARVWSVADGHTCAVLRGTPIVRTVAFSPDGNWLATGGEDAVVSVYDTREWQRRATIALEAGLRVFSLAFSPDGTAMAVAANATESSKAAHVYLHDVPTWGKSVRLEGHINLLYEVAFSPDSRRLATTAYDHTTRLWDRLTGQELARYDMADQGGASIAFSRDGRYLAVGLYNGGVRLWDIGAAGEQTAGAHESARPPKAVLASPPDNGQAPTSGSPVAERETAASQSRPPATASSDALEGSPAPGLPRGDPAPLLSFDRRAAEYVLSIGGTVRINDTQREIKAVAELPYTPFHLTTVVLEHNQQVTDQGLACFEGSQELIYLALGDTPVSDAGLSHFRGCKKLRGFNLAETKVTDAGMVYFKDCQDLRGIGLARTQISDMGLEVFKHSHKIEYLYLDAAPITDVGLAHFRNSKNLLKHLILPNTGVTDVGVAVFEGCETLLALNLSGTRVTDAGLANFKGCKQLFELTLSGDRVTDIGLGYFARCQGLKVLNLSGTRASDAALSHFEGCEHIEWLGLDRTHVTDAGLASIASFTKLKYLGLRNTDVTSSKIEALSQALPRCKIESSTKEP